MRERERERDGRIKENVQLTTDITVLLAQDMAGSDVYTVYTSIPESLPFADIEGKLGSNGAKIQLGEVCFA